MVRYFGISHRTSVYHFERYTDVRYDIPKYRYGNGNDIIHNEISVYWISVNQNFRYSTVWNFFVPIFSVLYTVYCTDTTLIIDTRTLTLKPDRILISINEHKKKYECKKVNGLTFMYLFPLKLGCNTTKLAHQNDL